MTFVAVGLGAGYDSSMQMLVSNDGKSLVPREPIDLLGYAPGDLLEVSVLHPNGGADRISAKQHAGKLVDDPITGLPVIDFGPDAPILTHDQVRAMLVDFP